jgi:hypothetical protein
MPALDELAGAMQFDRLHGEPHRRELGGTCAAAIEVIAVEATSHNG